MHRPQDDVVPLHEPFETALRGFNRQQVLAHVESLEGQISMVTADRESALVQLAQLGRAIDQLRAESELLAHLRREAEKANEQVALMAQSPIVGASTRIQHIVALAEEEAAELKGRVEKETDELRARAEQEVAELKERAEQEIMARRKRASSEAEALLRDMTQRCKQLEADSEQRRKAAEQEIARKESEAQDRIRGREQRGMAGLLLMLAILGPQLAERVAAVERVEAELAETRTRTGKEVSALEMLRAKITAQLATTRQVLAEALEQVQQTTADKAEPAHPVPAQRAGRPGMGNGAAGGLVQRVNSRADDRRSHA